MAQVFPSPDQCIGGIKELCVGHVTLHSQYVQKILTICGLSPSKDMNNVYDQVLIVCTQWIENVHKTNNGLLAYCNFLSRYFSDNQGDVTYSRYGQQILQSPHAFTGIHKKKESRGSSSAGPSSDLSYSSSDNSAGLSQKGKDLLDGSSQLSRQEMDQLSQLSSQEMDQLSQLSSQGIDHPGTNTDPVATEGQSSTSCNTTETKQTKTDADTQGHSSATDGRNIKKEAEYDDEDNFHGLDVTFDQAFVGSPGGSSGEETEDADEFIDERLQMLLNQPIRLNLPRQDKSTPKRQNRGQGSSEHSGTSNQNLVPGTSGGSGGVIEKRAKRGSGPKICTYCGKKFRNKSGLETHVRVHTGAKPFECDLCDFRTHNKSNLFYHRLRHTKERNHVCEICGKRFKMKQELKDHIGVHSDEKPFKCDDCEYRSHNKINLRLHKRIHATEYKYVCDICGSRHKVPSILRRHKRTHENRERIKCPNCDKMLIDQRSLKRHVRTVHTFNPVMYPCQVCGKEFTQNGNLKVHMRSHNDERRFLCDNCGRGFVHKVSLTGHLQGCLKRNNPENNHENVFFR